MEPQSVFSDFAIPVAGGTRQPVCVPVLAVLLLADDIIECLSVTGLARMLVDLPGLSPIGMDFSLCSDRTYPVFTA